MFDKICMYFIVIWLGFGSSLYAIPSNSITITQGWNLLGAVTKFDPHQLTCANVVWTYKDNAWSLFGANITNANNYGQPKLEELNPGEGYWVYTSTTGCTSFPMDIVAPENNFTTSINTNYFVDSFIDVPFDEMVNRSFQYISGSSSALSQTNYQMITFNYNGIATIIVPSCSNNEHTTVFHLKIENSFLNFYDNGTYVKSYKILAMDSNVGLVLGEVNQNSSSYSSAAGNIFALLNVGVVKNPINMGDSLPYSFYSLSGGEGTHTDFDGNGTYISYFDNNNSLADSGTFTINQNGAIYAEQQDIDDNTTMGSAVQTTNSVGRYNISSAKLIRIFESNQLSYMTSNAPEIVVNLADNNVSNWNQFFLITNNKLNEERYDNGSIYLLDSNTSLGTYEISSDGKTMTTNYINTCKPMPKQQIFNGNVVSWTAEMERSMVTGSTPLIK